MVELRSIQRLRDVIVITWRVHRLAEASSSLFGGRAHGLSMKRRSVDLGALNPGQIHANGLSSPENPGLQ
jgi:hypothetical protein